MPTTGGTESATDLLRPPIAQQPQLLRQLLRDPRPALDELRDRWGPVVGLGAVPMRLAVVGGGGMVVNQPEGGARLRVTARRTDPSTTPP